MTPITLAQAIPVFWRRIIYSVLAAAVPIEAVIDVVPADIESKAIAVLVILGFGVALGNTLPGTSIPRSQ